MYMYVYVKSVHLSGGEYGEEKMSSVIEHLSEIRCVCASKSVSARKQGSCMFEDIVRVCAHTYSISLVQSAEVCVIKMSV